MPNMISQLTRGRAIRAKISTLIEDNGGYISHFSQIRFHFPNSEICKFDQKLPTANDFQIVATYPISRNLPPTHLEFIRQTIASFTLEKIRETLRESFRLFGKGNAMAYLNASHEGTRIDVHMTRELSHFEGRQLRRHLLEVIDMATRDSAGPQEVHADDNAWTIKTRPIVATKSEIA